MMVCQRVGDRRHLGVHCGDGGTEAWASVGLSQRPIYEDLVTDWMWEVRVRRHGGLSTSDPDARETWREMSGNFLEGEIWKGLWQV